MSGAKPITMNILHLGLAGMFAAGLAFSACTDGRSPQEMERQADRTAAEFEADRHAATENLRDIRTRLEHRREAIDARLENTTLTADERREWETRRTEADTHMQRVQDDIDRVQGATDTVWEDVKQGVTNTANDVGDWFAKQADKIDRKTEADHDKDGK